MQISIKKKRVFFFFSFPKVVKNPCKTHDLGGWVSLVEHPFWEALTQLYPLMLVWPNYLKCVKGAICNKSDVLNMHADMHVNRLQILIFYYL